MNGSSTEFGIENTTSSRISTSADDSFGRHEFLRSHPWTAVPSIIVLTIASLGGTVGNVVTLLALSLYKKIKKVETIFIVNLALSDLFVTAVADPMSILAKLEGEHFFDSVPYLCQAVGNLCTISCVSSLSTIAMMSFNRYIFVCHNKYYKKVFSKRNSIIICVMLHGIGLTLVLLNQAGIGDHTFDRKSLQCIWDRMAVYPYTVVFSVTLFWVPCTLTGVCYSRLYIFVRNQTKIITSYQIKTISKDLTLQQQSPPNLQLDVAKTIFLIYAVFVTFWAPYALIMVIDVNDTFSHEAHVFITTFAHLHPSVNWVIYLTTQKSFAEAYRYVLACNCFSRSKHVRR